MVSMTKLLRYLSLFFGTLVVATILQVSPAAAATKPCTITNATHSNATACARVWYVNGPYSIHGVNGYYDVKVTVQMLESAEVASVQYRGSVGGTPWTTLVTDGTWNSSSVQTTTQVRITGQAWLVLRLSDKRSDWQCIHGTC